MYKIIKCHFYLHWWQNLTCLFLSHIQNITKEVILWAWILDSNISDCIWRRLSASTLSASPWRTPVRIDRCSRIQRTSARTLNTILMLIAPLESRERSANMQRSAVVVVADKTSLKRPFIFTNAVHMVGDWNYFCMQKKRKVRERWGCVSIDWNVWAATVEGGN